MYVCLTVYSCECLNLCLCGCIHTYMYVRMVHIFSHTCMYECTSVCLYGCMCVSMIYTHTYTFMYMYIHVYFMRLCTLIYLHLAFVQSCIPACTSMNIRSQRFCATHVNHLCLRQNGRTAERQNGRMAAASARKNV